MCDTWEYTHDEQQQQQQVATVKPLKSIQSIVAIAVTLFIYFHFNKQSIYVAFALQKKNYGDNELKLSSWPLLMMISICQQ